MNEGSARFSRNGHEGERAQCGLAQSPASPPSRAYGHACGAWLAVPRSNEERKNSCRIEALFQQDQSYDAIDTDTEHLPD